MLGLGIRLLDDPSRLVPMLEQSGRRHATYGVLPRHYPVVRQAMVRMLQRILARSLTPETL